MSDLPTAPAARQLTMRVPAAVRDALLRQGGNLSALVMAAVVGLTQPEVYRLAGWARHQGSATAALKLYVPVAVGVWVPPQQNLTQWLRAAAIVASGVDTTV